MDSAGVFLPVTGRNPQGALSLSIYCLSIITLDHDLGFFYESVNLNHT